MSRSIPTIGHIRDLYFFDRLVPHPWNYDRSALTPFDLAQGTRRIRTAMSQTGPCRAVPARGEGPRPVNGLGDGLVVAAILVETGKLPRPDPPRCRTARDSPG